MKVQKVMVYNYKVSLTDLRELEVKQLEAENMSML